MKTKLLVLLFSIAVVSTAFGSKKAEDSPIRNSGILQKTSSDNGMMIIAKLTVKPDKIKAFTEAAKEMIEKSNKEPGCLSYQLYQDPYTNTKFVFVEEYKNQAAIDAHFAADYFKAFGPKISDLTEGPASIKIITKANEVMK